MPVPYDNLQKNLTNLSPKHASLVSMDEGICLGLVSTLAGTALIGQPKKFEERVKLLCTDLESNNIELNDTKYNSLANLVDPILDKVKNRKNISTEEEYYLEMLPFFETVVLYHAPHYTELAHLIPPQDISKTIKYAMSLELEKKFEDKESMIFNPIYNQQMVFAADNDIISYLINELDKKDIDNFAMIFQTQHHAIGIVKVDGKPMIFDMNFLLEEGPTVVFKPYTPKTFLNSLFESKKVVTNISVFASPEDCKKIPDMDLHEILMKEISYQKMFNTSCNNFQHKNSKTGKSLVFFAAHYNNIDLLKKLLEKDDIDINQKSNDGKTPLWSAIEGGSNECAKLLLERKAAANVSILNKNGHLVTAIFTAAKMNRVDIVKMLLDAGADVSIPSGDPRSSQLPIHIAAKAGNPALVSVLLNHEKVASVDINSKSADGKTPLWFAVESGSVECTQLLLDKGASQNVKAFDKEKNKVTMLFQAVQQNNVELVKLLLNKGVNSSEPSFYKGNNLLPIHMAIQNNNFSMVQLLLDDYTKANKEVAVNLCDSNGTSALMFAAAQSHIDIRIVEFLLSHKIDINLANNDSATALSIATKNKAYNVMDLLLNHHAAVNVAWGTSPLMEAADNGDIKAIKILLENKTIDINYKSPLEHKTALSIAVSNGDIAATQLLISAGAAVDNSLILDAARSGNPHILSLVLDKIPIADLNVERNNITPLIAVVQKGNSEMVKELIKAGADVNYQTRNGNTALMKAASMGNVDMLTQLLESKADVTLVNQRGETALLSAVLTGQADVAAKLLAADPDVPAFMQKLLLHIQAGILNTDWSKQVTRSDKMTISTQDIEKEVPSAVAAVFVEVNKALHAETSTAYYQGLTQVARLLEDRQKNSNRTSVFTRYFKSAPRWIQECDDWLQQINLIREPLATVLKQNEKRPTKS